MGITQRGRYVCSEKGYGTGFAWMRVEGTAIYSCYWRPGTSLAEFSSFLDDLSESVRLFGGDKVVVCGDFNAWNVEWGSRVSSRRGTLLSDFAWSLGLVLANRGSSPTFSRGDASSIIDVTFFKSVEIQDWRVMEEDSLSDHRYIFFAMVSHPEPQAVVDLALPARFHPGWSVKGRDPLEFAGYVESHPLNIECGDTVEMAVASAQSIDRYLTGACDASMPPRSRGLRGKLPVHWWSNDLKELRRKVLSLRRSYQDCLRRAGMQGSEDARSRFTLARKDLRLAIRRAKDKSWQDLCDSVENDPWGKAYRIVMKKYGNRHARDAAKGREHTIADHLFPIAPPTDWDLAPAPEVRNLFDAFDPETDTLQFQKIIPPFTLVELKKASKRLSAGKAGGPSGIPNEAVKQLVAMRPHAVLRAFNNCLKALHFPQCWKKAKLVLLYKGDGKPVESPSSFRPICLLDTSAKLLERMLLQRLEEHLDGGGGNRRAPNQFGFRKGISTETAVEKVLSIARRAAAGTGPKELCVLVTLDVKNAFNSLRWPVIDQALRSKGTPEYLVKMLRSWLSDRSLLVGDDRTSRTVTCGVPQGSVLGPTLWNTAYDDLLNLNVPPGVQLVGFADDLAVVGRAKTGPQLEDLMNPVLEAIDVWMRGRGLELAHHKSEAVMLTRRWSYTAPRLRLGEHDIALSSEIRYLGVRLDGKMTFVDHVRMAGKKALASATALSRVMPNIKGPGQWKRRLLGSVVESQLLYAAPVWADTVAASARSVRLLVRPQRAIALRVIRAYRTVSDEAALVLAYMPPANLLAEERARVKARRRQPPAPDVPPTSLEKIKSLERKTTLDIWQRSWAFSRKGQWTRRLIPDVRRWHDKLLPKVPTTYRVTQAMTGHGCFQYYLSRMGRAGSPVCVQCGSAIDTVEHTLLKCAYWEPYRVALSDRLGHRLTVEDMSSIILGPSEDEVPEDQPERGEALEFALESLRMLYKFIEEILSIKEEEERARQNGQA